MRSFGDGRMEELILKDMEDMIQKLKEIPWFEKCQQSDAISKFDISYCNSVNSTIKHCSSIQWENLLLDKSEDISCHIIVNGIKTKYKEEAFHDELLKIYEQCH